VVVDAVVVDGTVVDGGGGVVVGGVDVDGAVSVMMPLVVLVAGSAVGGGDAHATSTSTSNSAGTASRIGRGRVSCMGTPWRGWCGAAQGGIGAAPELG